MGVGLGILFKYQSSPKDVLQIHPDLRLMDLLEVLPMGEET